MSFNRDIAARDDGPVTMQAGPEWIPLQGALDVEPGSTLDFSALCGPRVPAETLGWVWAVKANPAEFVTHGALIHALNANQEDYANNERMRIIRAGQEKPQKHLPSSPSRLKQHPDLLTIEHDV